MAVISRAGPCCKALLLPRLAPGLLPPVLLLVGSELYTLISGALLLIRKASDQHALLLSNCCFDVMCAVILALLRAPLLCKALCRIEFVRIANMEQLIRCVPL